MLFYQKKEEVCFFKRLYSRMVDNLVIFECSIRYFTLNERCTFNLLIDLIMLVCSKDLIVKTIVSALRYSLIRPVRDLPRQ